MAQTSAPAGSEQGGLPYALAAYGIWGFVPLFFKLVSSVPPVEVLAQRIIWSLPLCFLIMVFRRQIGDYLAALRDPRVLRMLLASSLLIAVNWLVYIFSIFTDHVLAASLGYYLNPLVNVMLGMLFLGERLSRLQFVAVVIAAGLLFAYPFEMLALVSAAATLPRAIEVKAIEDCTVEGSRLR